ncbi:DUF1826 domain-containing protein [Sphingomonas koreensis]|jgi:hypothetical protein|uniref:DUF1826 domain-containing protein n=1 Tax=Sphingomonas koreensis TaxID=93064 RepID=A0A1L6J9F5_9SPHN|nr:DUF1826 domain-containing protein [Sphingomonas koreensis]APR52545.1 hypothetical protein BRX40_08955 [Sphingomonas koreensis]MDC7811727.1 DUF1826 domain-containing protein [Sphingomonas koreensis]RSU18034.1 DUF1826 domain-containing protein [Sphingomonas koreensis]RSU22201.1 DUF1826 domain-containing protein [Sphingomonas koreensis]RSU23853.1 DUF1826 domain-containing protein [Sphingomonas koreensis]
MATQLHEALIDPVVSGDDAEALLAIREREVALALWARETQAPLTEAIEAIDLNGVDDLELTIELPLSPTTLAMNLVVSGYDENAAHLLSEDIVAHATRFARIAQATRLTVRLEIVESDACRRFHADYVSYRLLTTYRGPGTEWIRAGQPDSVERMRAGDVAIFKGRLRVEEPTILHRSPPIEGSGEQRLLLVIDPPASD